MPEQEKGTQELKQAITGAIEIIEAAIRIGSDGFQISDTRIIITDPELKTVVEKALRGSSEIPAEIQDLGFMEGADVVAHAGKEVRDIFV